jgi:hypothetical protein
MERIWVYASSDWEALLLPRLDKTETGTESMIYQYTFDRYIRTATIWEV